MTRRRPGMVVSVPEPAPTVGAALYVDGAPFVVAAHLPRKADRPPAVRVLRTVACGRCETRLLYQAEGWRCPECGAGYDRAAMAALVVEGTADGERQGEARRERGRRARRADRWRRELGLAEGVLPTDALWVGATRRQDWPRALTVARLALHFGDQLTAADRARWRERRDAARAAL